MQIESLFSVKGKVVLVTVWLAIALLILRVEAVDWVV